MKRYVVLCIYVIGLLSGCDKIDRLVGNKPYLEFSHNQLTIRSFEWGYGKININQYSGDFEKLDKKVFNTLKGKEGTVRVSLENVSIDQYGKESVEAIYIGDINLTELNKYEEWEYWHKASGIKLILNQKYFEKDKPIVVFPNNNSSVTHKIAQQQNAQNIVDPVYQQKSLTKPKQQPVIKFLQLTEEDLYPDPEARELMGYQGYTNNISGVIKAANFYHGTLEIKGDDGDYYALRIRPDDLPTSLKSELRYFMKVGNRISSICSVAGARELIIVNARFIEQ